MVVTTDSVLEDRYESPIFYKDPFQGLFSGPLKRLILPSNEYS